MAEIWISVHRMRACVVYQPQRPIVPYPNGTARTWHVFQALRARLPSVSPFGTETNRPQPIPIKRPSVNHQDETANRELRTLSGLLT